MKGRRIFFVFFLCLIAFPQLPRAGMFDMSEEQEVNMGEDVARAIIGQYGLLDDPAEVERLRYVSESLIKVSARAHLTYHFYIIDTDMVNAFAVPGGYIFVTRGLMDYIEDDDELAAVIGHELVHIALRHSVVMYKKGMKNMLTNFLLLLLTKDPNILIGATMLQQGRQEIFGRQAEIDADYFGAKYAVTAGYDPNAMIRFFNKLERLELHRPPLFDGYFDVHPPTKQRISIIKSVLDEMGLDVDEEDEYNVQARTFAREDCAETETACLGVLMSGEMELMRLAGAGSSASPYARAQETALRLNRIFDNQIRIFDVQVMYSGETPGIWIRDQLIVNVLTEDAAAAGLSADRLVADWEQQLKNFIWSEQIKDG